MSETLVSNIIYGALTALAAVTVHAITFRLLFVHRKLATCSTRTFCNALNFLNRLNARGDARVYVHKLRQQTGLGWLDALPEFQDWNGIACAIEECGRRTQWHLATLHGAATLGPLLGLFGTVAGFLFAEHADGVGLGLAFRTTMFGIGIAIPAFLYQCMNSGWQSNIEKQVGELQSAVARVAAFPPVAVDTKTPVVEAVQNNGHTNGRLVNPQGHSAADPIIVVGGHYPAVPALSLDGLSPFKTNITEPTHSEKNHGLETQQTAFIDFVAGDGGCIRDCGTGVEPAEPAPLRPVAPGQPSRRRSRH